MYNDERKERFIEESTSTQRSAYYIKAILGKFTEQEEKLDRDLCLWTSEELEVIINNCSGTRMQSAERAFAVVTKYVNWCKRQGFETSNGIKDVKVDVIERIKDDMVSSPLDLQRRLEEAFGDAENETIACIYKAYFWMAFAGLEDVEALEVTAKEVNLFDLEIEHKNEIYQLYKESKDAIRKACYSTSFKYVHNSRGINTYETWRDRIPGDKVVRGVNENAKTDSVTNMRVRISRILSAVNDVRREKKLPPIKLTYKKIFYSGLFYRMYQRELAREKASFKEGVRAKVSKASYKFSDTYTFNTITNAKTRALEVDYDRWKCAFAV